MLLRTILFIFLLNSIENVRSQETSTYRAGVVEFGVNFSSNLTDYFENNLERYLEIVSQAARENVDILIFPESTLNYGFTSDRSVIIDHAMEIPSPDDGVIPCDVEESHWILKAISCAAKDGHLYVIINVSEKLVCDDVTKTDMNDARDCHSDGQYLFNSNVVFDRNGAVVSRYRKTHLFGEFAFNTTLLPEIVTFDTDFGVTFGHLICFDLQYRTPAQVLLGMGVKNFILPLMWYSELPFLTSVQYEWAWSYSHGVNLLASGASSPASGSGGSALLSGRQGDRASVLSGVTTTRLLTADLFKRPEEGVFNESGTIINESPRSMRLLRDHLHLYTIKFIDPANFTSTSRERICYLDFCCDFDIRLSFYGNVSEAPTTPHYSYALVAFRGVRTFSGVASGGVENCGLVACTSLDEDDCGMRFSASTDYSPYIVFEELKVYGNFTQENSAQYPVTLTGNILPLSIANLEFDSLDFDSRRQVTVSLLKNQSDLLTFGVYGRVFSMDCDPETTYRGMKSHRNSDLSDDCLFNTNSGGVLSYLWSKLAVPIFIVTVYILEMM